MADFDEVVFLQRLLPEGATLGSFAPVAALSAPLDTMVFLEEDVGYRARPVTPHLTLLLHPQEDRVVGVKIEGWSQVAMGALSPPGAPKGGH